MAQQNLPNSCRAAGWAAFRRRDGLFGPDTRQKFDGFCRPHRNRPCILLPVFPSVLLRLYTRMPIVIISNNQSVLYCRRCLMGQPILQQISILSFAFFQSLPISMVRFLLSSKRLSFKSPHSYFEGSPINSLLALQGEVCRHLLLAVTLCSYKIETQQIDFMTCYLHSAKSRPKKIVYSDLGIRLIIADAARSSNSSALELDFGAEVILSGGDEGANSWRSHQKRRCAVCSDVGWWQMQSSFV